MDWIPGYCRLFMSYIAREKEVAGHVKESLGECGVCGFLAHEDIAPSRDWQDEIEEALQTCEAVAVFLHAGFKESDWTDQEVGYCLQRGVKIIPLRFDLDPYGFMGRFQAAQCAGRSSDEIAELIFTALLDDTRTTSSVTSGLVRAVADSGSFRAANNRSRRLERVKSWSRADLTRLRDAVAENRQVEDAYDAKRRIEAILRDNAIEDAAPF